MTSGRWDILAVENDWHGADCARRWTVPETCSCGLIELVVRVEREAASEALRRIREGVAGLSPSVDPLQNSGSCVDRAAVLLLIDTEIGAEPG